MARWVDECGGRKLREVKPTLEHWRSCSQDNRSNEVILCRLRIGHTYATHGHLLRGDEQPVCGGCAVPLTVAHVLLSCRRLEPDRTRYLGRIAPDITVRHLLGDESPWVLSGNIFSFIRSIKFQVIYSI